MTIYIDADACPVTRIAEDIARKHGIPVTLLCDTNHQLTSDYSTVKVIGAGADAVDIALINLCKRGDIVVTQDYGVAALALGKCAKAIHQSGRWYLNCYSDFLVCFPDQENRCGFHIVEFFNSHHPDPNDPDVSEQMDEQFPEGMFRFEKVMKS